MIDPEASIIDFYPEDFKIDLNGKKYAWQGVALLPFVEEVRLKAALQPLYSQLTEAEIQRNIRGDDRLFVREGHPGYNLLRTIYSENLGDDTEIILSPKPSFQGLGGRVLFSKGNCEPGGTIPTPVRSLENLENLRTIVVRYRDPKYDENFIFPAKRLDGATDPPAVLKPGDFDHRGNARGGGGANYTPRFGFGQRRDQASLDGAGHRMLNHYTNRNQGSYAAIPPPMYQNNMVQQNERGYQNRGYGNQGYNQNYGNNRGGGGRGHHGGGGYQGYNRNEPKFVHTRGGGGGQHGGYGGHGGHGGQWGNGGGYGNPSRNWNQEQQQRNYNSNHGGGYGNSSNYRGRYN